MKNFWCTDELFLVTGNTEIFKENPSIVLAPPTPLKISEPKPKSEVIYDPKSSSPIKTPTKAIIEAPLISIDNESAGVSETYSSTENLVPKEEPQSSEDAKLLRPQKKVQDVSTIKRQPKTGWL